MCRPVSFVCMLALLIRVTFLSPSPSVLAVMMQTQHQFDKGERDRLKEGERQKYLGPVSQMDGWT